MATNAPLHELSDPARLGDALIALRGMETEVSDAILRAENPMDAASLGRLAEALSVAKDAVFNATSTASSYCYDLGARAEIDRYHGRLEELIQS